MSKKFIGLKFVLASFALMFMVAQSSVFVAWAADAPPDIDSPFGEEEDTEQPPDIEGIEGDDEEPPNDDNDDNGNDNEADDDDDDDAPPTLTGGDNGNDGATTGTDSSSSSSTSTTGSIAKTGPAALSLLILPSLVLGRFISRRKHNG